MINNLNISVMMEMGIRDPSSNESQVSCDNCGNLIKEFPRDYTCPKCKKLLLNNIRDDFRIKLLIENYNLQKGEYEIGYQEYMNTNYSEFNSFLEKISTEPSYNHFPIIMTTEISYLKSSELNTYEIELAKTPAKFNIKPIKFYSRWIDLKIRDFELKTIEDLWSLRLTSKSITLKQEVRAISKISSILFFPIFAIFSFIFTLMGFMITPLNSYFLVIWGWLIGLSFFELASAIINISKFEKKRFLFFIPILNDIDARSVSRLLIRIIVIYGATALFYSGFVLPEVRTVFFNLNIIISFVLALGLPCSVIFLNYLILKTYFGRKKERDITIENINNLIQEASVDEEDKQFLIRLVIEIRNKNLVDISIFSRLITILTFFLATIPAITGLNI